MSQELTALDYELIRKVIARYAHSLDFGDFDGFVSCFTPDGSYETRGGSARLAGEYRGHAELRRFAEADFKITGGHVRHSILNTLIEGEGDTAYATSYLLITRDYGEPLGEGITPHSTVGYTGTYVDKLVLREGRWLFERRTHRADGHRDLEERHGRVDVRRLFSGGG